MRYRIIEIEQGHRIWNALLEVAPSIDEETVRYLTLQIDWAKSNHILVVMSDERPVGVLRFVTQRLGKDEERPPIIFM